MKAIYLNGFSIEQLQLTETAVPEPGPDEVLIKVEAVSLNYADYALVTGNYNSKATFPRIPVADGAGTVAAVGSNVSQWKKGDRVVSHFVQRWQSGKNTPATNDLRTGIFTQGMLAEYVVQPQFALVAIPDGFSFEQAASLPIAAVTAWNGLFNYANLTKGQTLLTQGTGAVSLFALQFARATGAKVIATTGSPEKEQQLRELGAWEVINYKQPNWVQQVRELTGGLGVDSTLDVSGDINSSVAAVKLTGFVGVVGFLNGLQSKIDLQPVIVNAITLQGFSVGSKADFENMLQSMVVNNIRPVIDRRFNIAQTQDAYRYFVSGKHFGKVIIAP